MKRVLLALLVLAILFSFTQGYSNAQFNPKGKFKVEVKASVGEYYLNISGYIAPYASVVMTSNGVFLRSTVADSKGYFYISQILIKKGLTGFCLEAIDFKRIGTSYVCLSFDPVSGDLNIKDIFMPPTLGLFRNEIPAGGEAIAFGYTMPYATVFLKVSDTETLTTTADGTGYYEFHIKGVKAGKYKLFATAEYNGKRSLNPLRYVELKALSLWEQLLAFLLKIWKFFLAFITSLGLGPLWIGFPILILIIILILKLWPERFTFVYESKLIKFFSKLFRRHKKLHHWWWMGY